MKLSHEPVALAGAVRAVLAMAVAFGLGLTGEQVASVVVAVEVVSGLWCRRQVVPGAKIVDVDTPEEAFDLLTGDVEVDWRADDAEAEDAG